MKRKVIATLWITGSAVPLLAAAFLVVAACYRDAFLRARDVRLATARAGNVIGGGDWAAYRLIPDLVRGVLTNQPVMIRNPNATRPWQHVLEPLSGYLALGAALQRDRALSGLRQHFLFLFSVPGIIANRRQPKPRPRLRPMPRFPRH